LNVRQTDPQMDRQTDRELDRRTERLHMDRQAGTNTNSYIETKMNRLTDKHMIGQTDREFDRQTETTHGQTGWH
jgi:hypothetical protein